MSSDADRWDERYADALLAEPAPPAALATHPELEALVPSAGTALDVACGTGAQALWLAARGLRVTALDVSPRAVDLVGRAARTHQLSDRIDARTLDLDGGLPPDATDLDVLICQRYRDPRLYDPFVRVLGPGGVAIVTVLSAVGLGTAPGPYHAPPGDLSLAFDRPEVECLLHEEGEGVASIVVRRR